MKKLWGSRFKEELAADAKDFSFSLAVDYKLLPYEVEVSAAHARMLAKAGLIKKTEAAKIVRGLQSVYRELQGMRLSVFAKEYEDVHALLEDRLAKKIGDAAKKLHTGRSRNDLVSTSTRLYVLDHVWGIMLGIRSAQKSLVGLGVKYQDTVIPGYTHLQRAQPVLLAHHLLAYVEMLERDLSRFDDAARRMNISPLGSGALAGSTLPLDRNYTAKLLGFSRPAANSLDAVSDRDFVIEVLSAIALLMTHLSRLSEDLILWNSSEFGFMTLPDSYSTGSSLMPHKKNPDMAELTRGRAGAAVGALVSVLVMMKGLPLSYNRDMQEDKKSLFEGLDLAIASLGVMANMISKLRFNSARCAAAVSDPLLYATDLVDYLILKKMPFRTAHETVGKLVAQAAAEERALNSFSVPELKKFSALFEKNVADVFKPEKSLARKKTAGSTQPAMVKAALKQWVKRLR